VDARFESSGEIRGEYPFQGVNFFSLVNNRNDYEEIRDRHVGKQSGTPIVQQSGVASLLLTRTNFFLITDRPIPNTCCPAIPYSPGIKIDRVETRTLKNGLIDITWMRIMHIWAFLWVDKPIYMSLFP
jgi:hypothetical protein